MSRYFILSIALMATACADIPVAELNSAATQYDRTFCSVAGASENRTDMYNPTPQGDILLELERSACHRIAHGTQPPAELQALGGGFHEAGITLVDGGPVLFGKEASDAYFSQFYKAETDFLTWEPVEAHVSEANDMGWVFGLYKFQPEGGELEVGKYISVLQKKDGKWRIVAEVRNPF